MDILDKPEYAELRHFFERAEQRLFSRKFTLFAAVIAVLGLAGSLAAMLPFFQNAAMSFTEQVLLRSAIDREVWRANLFTAAFAFVFIFALAVAFFVSVENDSPAIKKMQIPLAVSLLFIAILYIALITYYYGHYWINSDCSVDLLGAKTLAEANAVISPKWHYGNEPYVIYRQPFAILLFKIFDNWPLIRAVNTFLMLLALTSAFLFMMSRTKVQLKHSLLACAFMIVPLSNGFWAFVIFGKFYIFFFIKVFVMTGCFLSFIKQNQKSFSRTVSFILFYALAFITGIEGIRIFYNFLLPLALAVFLASFFDFIKEKKTACKAVITALLLSGFGFCLNYLAFYTNIFTFVGFNRTPLESFGSGFFDKFSEILFNAYVDFWGYKEASVLSPAGILSILSLIVFALSFAGFAYLLKNTFIAQKKPLFAELRKTSSVEYFLIFYTAITLVFHFVFFLFINISDYIRYFYASFVFQFAAFPVFMFLFCLNKNRLVHLFIWIIAFVLLFGHGALIFSRQMLPSANENANRAGYLSFLEKNKLFYGFATYWNSIVNTELSNGKIEMVGLSDKRYADREFTRAIINTPAKFDDPYYHTGEAFLLLSKQEWEEARKERTAFDGKIPAYEDDFFVVLLYPNAAIIHREVMGETF